MARSHKGQHSVPRSYLAAWEDPDTPPNHEPFVHVFTKDGSGHRTKAPANIFRETDMYTVKLPDGQRDLHFEHGLCQIEQGFFISTKLVLHPGKTVDDGRIIR